MNTNYTHIVHPIPPFYDESSRVLILGSFPSVKSRESRFFYGHPQNRFWPMMAMIFEEYESSETAGNAAEAVAGAAVAERRLIVPSTIEEKAAFLRRHHMAAWDTIHECDIVGSSDSSIKNVVVNDLSVILDAASIGEIYCNGRKSYDLYMRYCREQTGRDAKLMPSTSPANAACSMDKLIETWQDVRKYCE